MKIVAGMLVRNEQWCIGATVSAALDWCDEIVLLDDNSSDNTMEIARSFGNRVITRKRAPRGEFWDEMEARQELADLVLARNPEVFALVDGDEMLPVPFRRDIRAVLDTLPPDTVLAPQALNPWNSLDEMRVDRCQWTTNFWTAAIKIGDVPLVWKSAKDGYTHHHRVPDGVKTAKLSGPVDQLGVVHLQFASLPRRWWKHKLYVLTEWLRWGREGRKQSSPRSLLKKYGAAFDEKGLKLEPVPDTWFHPEEKSAIFLASPGWYKAECERLIHEHPEIPEELVAWNLI